MGVQKLLTESFAVAQTGHTCHGEHLGFSIVVITSAFYS